MQWLDDHTLVLGDVTFNLEHGPGPSPSASSRDRFMLRKTSPMIRDLAALFQHEHITNLLEIGIYKGGSCVLYHQLFHPAKLVAIEVNTRPEPALTDYIQRHDLSNRVKLYYGVDQADHSKLTRIVNAEFPNQPLDVVIDDASHLFQETRTSFMALFPLLRPNGYYIIEDWGWAHWPGSYWQASRGFWASQPALTNLIVEIVMLSTSRPDLVSSITMNDKMAVIRRGISTIEPGQFNLEKLYLSRGWKWRPII